MASPSLHLARGPLLRKSGCLLNPLKLYDWYFTAYLVNGAGHAFCGRNLFVREGDLIQGTMALVDPNTNKWQVSAPQPVWRCPPVFPVGSVFSSHVPICRLLRRPLPFQDLVMEHVCWSLTLCLLGVGGANSVGAKPPGGGPISISNLMNSEVRSNLQVQWVKLSVGHWRTAADPLLCISVAYSQASSCLLFCDRKVPMVL